MDKERGRREGHPRYANRKYWRPDDLKTGLIQRELAEVLGEVGSGRLVLSGNSVHLLCRPWDGKADPYDDGVAALGPVVVLVNVNPGKGSEPSSITATANVHWNRHHPDAMPAVAAYLAGIRDAFARFGVRPAQANVTDRQAYAFYAHVGDVRADLPPLFSDLVASTAELPPNDRRDFGDLGGPWPTLASVRGKVSGIVG